MSQDRDRVAQARFRPISLSVVSRARKEPYALLVGELAYGGQGGPELAYRFERLNR